MGVQGLWQLLHPAGKPVSPSSLEGKVLAVDVSIWLHQTMKGMRDRDGNPLPNAHLQGLFSRICKLLFYRIRPIFVFDGGVPALKKQTMAIRRERKEAVERQKGLVTRKILENLLRSHAVSGLTGDRTGRPDLPSRRRTDLDLFELPPLPESEDRSPDAVDTVSLWEVDNAVMEEHRDMVQSIWGDLQNLEEIDTESEEFQSLPPEIRHEILSEMKEQRREHALARISIMPEDSRDFSDYQLQKLIRQSRLSNKIESVRKEMNRSMSGDITYALGDNYYGEVVEANRVVSEDAAHYVLIKGLTRKQQVAQAELCLQRRLSKAGKRELEEQQEQGVRSDTEMDEGELDRRCMEERDLECAGLESSDTESRKTNNRDTESGKTESSDVESRVTAVSTETCSDQDNGVEMTARSRKRASRNIHLDNDGEMSDESDTKQSRRERRGKSLVTRTGVRNVSKGIGKSFKAAGRRLTAVDGDKEEEEEGASSEMAVEDQNNFSLIAQAEGRGVVKDGAAGRSGTLQQDEHGEDLCGDGSLLVTAGSSVILPHTEVQSYGRGETVDRHSLRLHGNDEDLRGDGSSLVNADHTAAVVAENWPVTVSSPSSVNACTDSAQGDTDFMGTQNRLLREEEDLSKAMEAKMATLLKCLEKRKQTMESAPKQPAPDGEGQPLQRRQGVLWTQEVEMGKERDSKTAALLPVVEKQSCLQSTSVRLCDSMISDLPCERDEKGNRVIESDLPCERDRKGNIDIESDLPCERDRKGNRDIASDLTCERDRKGNMNISSELPCERDRKGNRKKQTTSGFLEDMAELERRTVQKKVKSRQTKQKSTEETTSPSSSLSSSAFPALTVDYLEDLESMAEVDTKQKAGTDTNDAPLTHERNASDKSTFQETSSLMSSPKYSSSLSEEPRGETEKPREENVLCSDPEKEEIKREVCGTQEKGVDGCQTQSADIRWDTLESETARPEESQQENKRLLTQLAQPLVKDEDSEDEGFIEITINPSKIVEDDELFPASIFASGAPEYYNSAFLHSHASQARTVMGTTPLNIGMGPNDRADQGLCDAREVPEPSLLPEEGNLQERDRLGQKVVCEAENTSAGQKFFGESKKKSAGGEKKVVGEMYRDSSVAEKTDGACVVGADNVGEEENGKKSQGRRLSVQTAGDDDHDLGFSKAVSSLSDLYDLQRDLSRERKTLMLEKGRQARLGKSVTEQINLEAQELLQLFGVPYLVSPMEAEAQCANLELTGLTQGTVTDDSDAWLFGASRVYKNFFNNAKYVEFYSADAVKHHFGLDRHKLINVALLCGSDYTPGIPGVGPVRAMEIMAQFPGDGLQGLFAFREWWEDAQAGRLSGNQGKVKNPLRRLELHDGFPSRQVVDAYLRPEVDESEEPFSWGLPDVDLLRQYAKQKFGWTKQKTDEVLEPMMKELTKKTSQGRIHSYFQPENFVPPKPVKSRRLQRALDKFQGRASSSASESSEQSESSSGSESESDESQAASHQTGKGIVGKSNQGMRGKGNSTSSTSRGRGQKGGRSGAQSSQLITSHAHETKGAKYSVTGAGKSPGSKAGARGKKAPNSDTAARMPVSGAGMPSILQAESLLEGRGRGKRQQRRGRGRLGAAPQDDRPAQQKKRRGLPLKDEVSLSESSSSSDSESRPKKGKSEPTLLPGKPVAVQKLAMVRRRTGVVPNIKKLAHKNINTSVVNQKQQPNSRVSASAEDSITFREAMGGDLDPTMMTLDDLGSDFSEEDFM